MDDTSTDKDDFYEELRLEIENIDIPMMEDMSEYDDLVKLGRISKSTRETKNLLPPIISEYLSCYRLVGYDLHGNEVVISNHSTPIEKSGMDHLFMREFSNLMSSQKKDNGI